MIHTSNRNLTSLQHNYIQQQQKQRFLPSVLTDFIAYQLCDFIRVKPTRIGANNRVPELLYLILKITSEPNISCHTAIVALVYIERCKQALPKYAIGDHDTIHRMLIASLLVASKFLNGCSNSQHGDYVSDDHDKSLTNARMAAICSRFYTLQEINQLESSFLGLIKFNCFVNPIEIQRYISKHRQDLLL